MRRSSRTVRVATALAFACVAPAAGAAQQPYEIGAVLMLSGPVSYGGQLIQKVMRVQEAHINKEGGIHGRPIKFVYRDDQSSPQVAVQLTSRIVASGSPVMIGSGVSGICKAQMPLVRSGPAMYCLSPAVYPGKGSFVFSSDVPSDGLIAAAIRYLRTRGLTRIAVVLTTDVTGQDAERHIKTVMAKAENRDMKIVATAHVNPQDLSIAAQMTNLKAQQPQAVLAWTTGLQFGTILRGLMQAAIDLPVMTTYGNLSYDQMKRFRAILPKELYFAGGLGSVEDDSALALDPRLRKVRRHYLEALRAAGLKPETGSEAVWDPVMIVVDALRKLGPNATARQIRDHIGSLRGFVGVNGIYDFVAYPQRGLSGENAVVNRWNSQKRTFELASELGGGSR